MKKIGIVPWSYHFNKNKMFDKTDKILNRDNILLPFYHLRENLKKIDIELNTIDLYDDYKNIDVIFFFKLNYEELYKIIQSEFKGILIYFAWEPVVVSKEHSRRHLKSLENIFSAIMTWDDNLVDNQKYFKINFPQHFEEMYNWEKSLLFSKKKLLTNISMDKTSNHPKELYSQRKEIINYFEKNHLNDFEFYGMRWKAGRYKSYKGPCESKIQTYSKYKFALCFENMKDTNGYITEKIFDCFKAGVVPVYWGAENIDNYIPKECYIDYRKFENIERMYIFLSEMTEETYNQYLNQIKEYLSNNTKEIFTEEFLKQQSLRVIEKINKNNIENIKISNLVKIYSKYYYIFFKRLIKKIVKRNY